jgi:hypothetical protein
MCPSNNKISVATLALHTPPVKTKKNPHRVIDADCSHFEKRGSTLGIDS